MVDGVTKDCEKSGEVSMNVLQVALARIKVFFYFFPIFSSLSLLYFSSSLASWAFGFITDVLSPRHFGQNHLPLGLDESWTQSKWNHSNGHRSLSHATISPNETCSHKQYVGSSGSMSNGASPAPSSESSACAEAAAAAAAA